MFCTWQCLSGFTESAVLAGWSCMCSVDGPGGCACNKSGCQAASDDYMAIMPTCKKQNHTFIAHTRNTLRHHTLCISSQGYSQRVWKISGDSLAQGGAQRSSAGSSMSQGTRQCRPVTYKCHHHPPPLPPPCWQSCSRGQEGLRLTQTLLVLAALQPSTHQQHLKLIRRRCHKGTPSKPH